MSNIFYTLFRLSGCAAGIVNVQKGFEFSCAKSINPNSTYRDHSPAAVSFDEEGKSKGFGFVNCQKHKEGQAAVDALRELEQTRCADMP